MYDSMTFIRTGITYIRTDIHILSDTSNIQQLPSYSHCFVLRNILQPLDINIEIIVKVLASCFLHFLISTDI